MSVLAALSIMAMAAVSTDATGAYDYRVRPHESLYDIAARGLSQPNAYLELQRLNAVRDPHHLTVGKIIKIPYRLLRTTPILATVEGFRGAVEVEASGRREDAVIGRTIGEGAAIETGANAFARLSLPDGSHIALPSNSKVRFDRLRSIALTGALDRAMTLQKGGATSTVTPMENPESRYVISTPVAVTSVRGTIFRTTYDASAAKGSAGVLRGDVAVSNAKAVEAVHVDQGVTATPAGVSKPKALLPAPVLAQPELPLTEARLHFDITPAPGAAAYHLILAKDEAIAAPLLDMISKSPALEADSLPDGAYYAELSAITPDGLEGKAGVYPVRRIRNGLTVGGVKKTEGGYLFSWSADGQAPATFHFELRRAGESGPALIDEPALTETRYAAKALPPGEYTWRVSASREQDGRKVQVWFDSQTLQVPH